MLKPSVQIHDQDGILLAEFWDCLRLDPAPVQELRSRYEAHLKKGPTGGGDRPQRGWLCGFGGAGEFRGACIDARKNGGRLIFCNVDPTVREVFRASKLESLFEFVADRAAALA